jgi:pSer/pThr/pTyr-binding forkhead associated (FHA) protein
VRDNPLFLTACGMTTPLHLDLEGPVAGRRTLPQPFAVIGRDPRSDVLLNDEQVSRRHAYLQVVAGQVFCADLGSRTGTHRPDGAEPARRLGDGQAIRVGPYTLRPRASDRPTLAPGELSLPEITLEFLSWTTGPVCWPMRRALVLVGRSASCGVRLPDPGVSKHHCSLVRTPMGLWVVDLLGRGIRVNGEAVRCARLGDCDELRVGPVLLRPRYGPPPEPGVSRGGAPARVAAVPLEPRPAARGGLPDPGSGPGESSPPPPVLSPATPELIAWPVTPERSDRAEVLLAPLVQQFGQMQQQMFDQFHQSIMMMFQMFGTLHRDQMGLLREEIGRVGQLTRELQELKDEATAISSDRSAREAPPAPAPGDRARDASEGPPADQARPNGPPGPPPESHAYEEIHSLLHQRIVAIQHDRQDRWQKILSILLNRPRDDQVAR